MNIRYVVSTKVFWWREHNLSFEQECEFLRSLGFGVEIWPTMRGTDECRFQRRNWDRLQLATEGMLVSLHSRQDRPNLEQWDEQLQCAKLLGGHMVTDLAGMGITGDVSTANWSFAGEVVKLAEKYEVPMYIENGHLPMLQDVGRQFSSLRYCIDTGHAYLDPEHTFIEYVNALAERTGYIHFTDNYGRGQEHEHEPPGVRGGMPRENWDYLLKHLGKYDHDVIGALEMYPCLPGTMIEQGSKFLFDVIGWPNRPQPAPGADERSYRPI